MPPTQGQSDLYSVPKFNLKKSDIEDFDIELKGFHELFSDCFQRSESKDHFFKYMVGQFSDLGRKAIKPIALSVEQGNVRAMQRFVSGTPWDDYNIGIKYRNFVNDDLGNSNGTLIFDEIGFVKKGEDSIGVDRQYCGTTGKIDNCQVGVFAAYASEAGYSLVDKQLFIPRPWFSDEYEVRRKKCNLPEDIVFKTKPQLAVEMLKKLTGEKILPFRYVFADTIYGESPDFIKAVESLPDITYMVSASPNTLCWLNHPINLLKEYKWGGKIKTRTILTDTRQNPITVETLAKNTNNVFWYRREVSKGTKNPVVYEFTKHRIVICSSGRLQREVTLLVRRTIGGNKESYRFFVCNASSSMKLKHLVWLSGMRWAIEQCFEETKTELGMGQYEVRKFMGWHHHMQTCMMAHFFLWHLKIRMGKKSSVHYAVEA